MLQVVLYLQGEYTHPDKRPAICGSFTLAEPGKRKAANPRAGLTLYVFSIKTVSSTTTKKDKKIGDVKANNKTSPR